ncbi:hypothetical protein FRX31_018125 [Thalictrum thalictroides]|uniref:Uncharacterized protein n=1 Tax=Thalictrum thalictroides TaxID=46969 RepID=A0A7J6W4J5_THATH|nr:hypothetical protein FRX31_018125 [Thalictrum thalictroides]
MKWNHPHPMSKAPFRVDRLSLSEYHIALQEGCSSDDNEAGKFSRLSFCLSFSNGILHTAENLWLTRHTSLFNIARRFHELKTLRSCTQHIYIYKIPTEPTLRGLDACFLTYLRLSTPTTGVDFANGPIITYLNGMDGDCKISLPVFYMVSYKLKGSMWVPNEGCEHQLSNSLLKAADHWQRLLQVNHTDF